MDVYGGASELGLYKFLNIEVLIEFEPYGVTIFMSSYDQTASRSDILQ